jgi:hypothetical protein
MLDLEGNTFLLEISIALKRHIFIQINRNF